MKLEGGCYCGAVRYVDSSLERLQTDHVDLLQAHRYDYATPLEETLRAFDDLVRQGKVRYIGLSEVGPETLRRANAVKAARKRVGSAVFFVELAPCVKSGKHQFGYGCFFFRMEPNGYTAAIVLDAYTTVILQGHLNMLAKSGERLICRVINDFLNNVQRAFSPSVHTRALSNWLETFQDPDG